MLPRYPQGLVAGSGLDNLRRPLWENLAGLSPHFRKRRFRLVDDPPQGFDEFLVVHPMRVALDQGQGESGRKAAS